MTAREPSPQLVFACLLEGCKPVPVDAVVCGRCETCGFDEPAPETDRTIERWCGQWLRKRTRPKPTDGCTDWKPRETVGEEESTR
jgi:hypothetical protein